jgi:hypothetical protein
VLFTALFWAVGLLAYCAGILINYLLPTFDWHVIRHIPIPEFQSRTNILVPLGSGVASRYAVISTCLTVGFVAQIVLALTIDRTKVENLEKDQKGFARFLEVKNYIGSFIFTLILAYLIFFWPQLVLESNSRLAVVYNGTDLKFFIYWGVATFVSLHASFALKCFMSFGANVWARYT